MSAPTTVRIFALLSPVLLGSCLDRNAGLAPSSDGAWLAAALIVSDPSGSSQAVNRGGIAPTVNRESFAYVSLPPGTVPSGSAAEIRNLTTGLVVHALLTNGGLDPVGIPAIEGDSLRIVVSVTGEQPLSAVVVVAHARPPVVVRTEPPPRKTGVPLNAAVMAVFSEPVDTATLTTENFALHFEGEIVRGQALPIDGGLWAEFRPDSSLKANKLYTFEVSTGVVDPDGQPLVDPVTVEFTTSSDSAEVSQVVVTPDTATLVVGSSRQLSAVLVDSDGNVLSGRAILWGSSNTTVVTVDQGGRVLAGGLGSATVTASAGSRSGQARITVMDLAALASLRLIPETLSVIPGGGGQILIVARDNAGRHLQAGQDFSFSVRASDTTIAQYIASGVIGRQVGVSNLIVAAGGFVDTSIVVVGPVSYRSVTLGARQTCGLTGGGGVFCWGEDHARPPSRHPSLEGRVSPSPVVDDTRFTDVAAGSMHRCVLGLDGIPRCWGRFEVSPSSWLIIGGPSNIDMQLTFRAISAGALHTCALADNGSIYCWGRASLGQLGDGGRRFTSQLVQRDSLRIVPVEVAGGLTFSAVATGAGGLHSCALTPDGQAYCWGMNDRGQLGVDSSVVPQCEAVYPCILTPVPVTGDHRFSLLSAGGSHACGLTPAGAIHCWGENSVGQLGEGTTQSSWTPVRVLSDSIYVTVSAGWRHTCAQTVSGSAYCWGDNSKGQLGNGLAVGQSSYPVAVVGGLTFGSIAAASEGHTCGVTTGGVTYCWGSNDLGQLGDGSRTSSAMPVRVVGQP